MVSFRNKKIKGKEYTYAEYSFRLPDKKIKKISKYVKDGFDERQVRDSLLQEEVEAYKKVVKYKADAVLSDEDIKQIEEMRVRFKQIKNSLTKAQMDDIITRFAVNFTYESNAIEGNSLTLKDVTLIVNQNIIPSGANLRDVYETRNTKEAIKMLFEGKIKISNKDIIELHKTLVKDTGINFGFKTIPNFLLGRNIKTTLPENVEKEMTHLIDWYDKNCSILHPLVLASEFHQRFEKIHPFDDGNGRTGRLLINAILIDLGYPPLIIRKTMKSAYFTALDAYDNGHKPKLVRFLLDKLRSTYENFFRIYVRYL
ncbi:MAG: Fic family protein [Candidatus Woesearchaeota archaeon]|jgi:Fic family protein